MGENETRENIEAELRVLHSQLDASSSLFGDWRMSKALESLIEKMRSTEEENLVHEIKSWFDETAETLSEIIEQRVAIRDRINELEKELEEG